MQDGVVVGSGCNAGGDAEVGHLDDEDSAPAEHKVVVGNLDHQVPYTVWPRAAM